MIVVDTNVVAYLVIEGAHTPSARNVYQKDSAWVLPPLWRSEFLNVLAVSVRAGVLLPREARRAWRVAVELLAPPEYEPNPLLALRLAMNKGISAYDAQFVVLAQTLRTVLVSGDRQLVRRCPEHTILMTDYAAM